jgi:hypothetical protein
MEFFISIFRVNPLFFLLRNKAAQKGCGKLFMLEACKAETYGYICGLTQSKEIQKRLTDTNKISSFNILTKATEEPAQ